MASFTTKLLYRKLLGFQYGTRSWKVMEADMGTWISKLTVSRMEGGAAG